MNKEMENHNQCSDEDTSPPVEDKCPLEDEIGPNNEKVILLRIFLN